MPVTINGSGSTGSINTAVLPSSGSFATQSYADTAGGLVKIATETFSAVSSVSVNNCFTSTYDQYLITLDYTQTTTDRLDARLRVGGVDNTTASSYASQIFYASGVGTGAGRSTSDKWNSWAESTSTSRMQANINVYSPAIARITGFTSFHQYGASNAGIQFSGGTHNQTVAYDGFTLIPATGTITGTVRVYGYRN